MRSQRQRWILRTELVVSWLVLLTLLYYTFLELVRAPYLGFESSPSTGVVTRIFVHQVVDDYAMQTGDVLVRVNETELARWQRDLRSTRYPAVEAGDRIELEMVRDGRSYIIAWPVPGLTRAEFRFRAVNAWWIGYLFWAAGLVTLLLVRPLDIKRSLFATFFLLTSLWLVIGITSRWGHADSRVLYRAVMALSVPVLLHLHWLFPRPLGTLPRWLLWLGYGASVAFAAWHWTPFANGDLALWLFAFGLIGSLLLMGLHFLRQPESRPQVRLLFYALLLSMLPVAVLSLTVALHRNRGADSFALAALPLIPGAYLYSILRFQLGGSELRANRLIALYLYLVIIGTGCLIIAAILNTQQAFVASPVLWSTLLAMAAALVTLYGFPAFQRLVDRRLLAMPLPPVQLMDTYLARITTTLNEDSLVELLKNEVLPSLLIRESALLRIRHNEAATVYRTGAELPPETVTNLMAQLATQPVVRITGAQEAAEASWVRLAMALRVDEKLVGIWLLGRHDPDDLYTAPEVANLTTLARQTALALANIDQAAQLQALYQTSIARQEQERMKMAHFLHDAVLNQAALLYMSLDMPILSPRVEGAYTTLKEQIHQMISNLRPPSLDLGLGAALEEMVSNFDERGQARFAMHLHLPAGLVKYPMQVENHIFRIVQQACENALRHAHATHIQVSGTLAPELIEVTVVDDGTGFELHKPIEMSQLLAHKHYGLVHMMERAEHIGAELTLDSAPGHGCRVHLHWRARGEG